MGLLVAAVGVGWIAYGNAWAEPLPWWWWLIELVAACVLFHLGQAKTAVADESTLRRLLRQLAGGLMVVALTAAITLEAQPGSEIAAILATLTAIAAFAAWRWLPFSVEGLDAVMGEPRSRRSVDGGRASTVLVGSSLLSGGGAVVCNFYTHYLAAFVLWLASLGLFAVAMWRRSAPMEASDSPDPKSQAVFGFPVLLSAVLVIVGVALAFRLVHIADIPVSINIDEGSHGRTSEIFWSKGFPDVFGYTPWNAFPNLSFLVGYLGIQLLGTSWENLRISSAIIGALGTLPLFFWTRRWWGANVALMAAALLAFNREDIYWSRLGINNIQTVAIAGLMLATLGRALRTRRPLDWVWLGYASGLAFHTYHAGKLYPVLLAFILVPFAIGVRGFARENRWNAVVALVAFLLLLGPLTLSTYLEWPRFYGSTANRSDLPALFAAFQHHDVIGVRNFISDHVVLCLRCLFNIPPKQAILIGPESGVLFAIGIGWILWRWRDPRNWVVIGWIAGILVVGGMMTSDPPWKARMLGFLPAVCVVPAIVADRIRATLLRCLPGRLGVVVVSGLLATWFGAIAYRSWDAELVYALEAARGDYTGTVSRLIKRTPLPATFYAAGSGVSGTLPDHAETIGLLKRSPERTFVDLVDDGMIVPVRPGHRGLAVFVVGANQKEILPIIDHYYPSAFHEPNPNVHGESEVDFFTLSAGDVAAHRGLQVTYRSPTRSWNGSGGTEVLTLPPGVESPLQVMARGVVWITPPGQYAFRATGGTLHIDGRVVTDASSIALVAGWHGVEIEATLTDMAQSIAFQWRKAEADAWETVPHDLLDTHPEVHGLLGRYFAKEIKSTNPAPIATAADYAQIEPLLSFFWGTPEAYEAPPPVFATRGSTLEWSGTVDFPEGTSQTVQLDNTTPAQVFVDGVLVLNGIAATGAPPLEATIAGKSKTMRILVRTTRPADDPLNYWRLRLLWRTPGGAWTAFVPYTPSQISR
ncbi:MAG: glycosyltransferase family 39 protein [Deltaproteobacteria bacterium]|nr:glycosyltransferase family 39 protein [Deltaproteobacteria bacterium]